MQLRYVLVLVLVCVLLLPVLLLAVVVLILLLYSARDYLYPQIASGVVPFNSLRGGRAMRNAFSPVFNSRCVVGPCPTPQGPTSHHYCCVLVLTASHRATAGQSYPYPDIHVAYIKYKTGWASCGPQSPVPGALKHPHWFELSHSHTQHRKHRFRAFPVESNFSEQRRRLPSNAMGLSTPFTRAFNLTVPVCLAPMAGVSGGRLAGEFICFDSLFFSFCWCVFRVLQLASKVRNKNLCIWVDTESILDLQ